MPLNIDSVDLILFLFSFSLLLLYYRCQKNKKHSNLELNQKLINEISGLETISEIRDKCIEHIEKSEIYKFDYAVISLINFQKRKIVSYANNNKIEWVEDSVYSIEIDKNSKDKNDILQELITKNFHEPVVVIGEKVFDNKFHISFENLNQTIFSKFEHSKYARVYIPIIFYPTISTSDKSDTNELSSLVLGVIEVGYIMPNKINPTKYDKIFAKYFRNDKIRNLFIYADNLAQVVNKVTIKDLENKLLNLFINSSREDHVAFTNRVLLETIKLFSFEYGYFGILNLSQNKYEILLNDVILHPKYRIKSTEIFREEIYNCQRVFDKVISEKSNINNNGNTYKKINNIFVDNNKFYIPVNTPKNNLFSVLLISCSSNLFVNSIYINIFEFIARELGYRYLSIRNFKGIKDLNIPISIYYFGIQNVLHETAEKVAKFFNINHVNIFKRVNNYKDIYNNYELIYDNILNSNFVQYELNDLYDSPNFIGQNINIGDVGNYDDLIIVKQLNNINKYYKYLIDKYNYISILLIRFSISNRYEYMLVMPMRRHVKTDAIYEVFREFVIALNTYFENSILLSYMYELISNDDLSLNELVKFIAEKSYNIIGQQFVGIKLRGISSEEFNHFVGLEKEYFVYRILLDSIIGFNSAESIIEINNNKDLKKLSLNNITDEQRRRIYTDLRNRLRICIFRFNFLSQEMGFMLLVYEKKLSKSNILDSIYKVSNKIINKILRYNVNLDKLNARVNEIKSEHEMVKKMSDILIEKQTILNLDIAKLERLNIERDRQLKDLVIANMDLKIKGLSSAYFNIFQIVNHDIYNYFVDLKHKIRKYDVQTKIDIENVIGLIDELIELFLNNSSEKEFISINNVIYKLVDILKRQNLNILFNTSQISKDIPDIKWNRQQFGIIIYNILNNAVYALNRDNKSVQKEIAITTNFYNNEYIVVVWDNGPGIKKTDLNDIFRLNWTTREEGYGIGLYYVKSNLEADENQGLAKITCNSKLGEYTEFVIKISYNINKL